MCIAWIEHRDVSSPFRVEFTTGDVVDSSPALGPDGTVYVGSRDDKLYAVCGGRVPSEPEPEPGLEPEPEPEPEPPSPLPLVIAAWAAGVGAGASAVLFFILLRRANALVPPGLDPDAGS